jgi:hypothetical protein
MGEGSDVGKVDTQMPCLCVSGVPKRVRLKAKMATFVVQGSQGQFQVDGGWRGGVCGEVEVLIVRAVLRGGVSRREQRCELRDSDAFGVEVYASSGGGGYGQPECLRKAAVLFSQFARPRLAFLPQADARLDLREE